MSERNDGRHIELDIEDLAKNKTSLRRYAVVLGIVFFIMLGVVGLFAASSSIPFEPLIVYDYTVDSAEYCPFDLVQVTQEIEVQDKWYYSLQRLESETYMSMEGRPYLSADANVDIEAMPRDVYPSSAIRTAPPIPGEWRAEGKGTLYGRMFGLVPVQQDIAVVATPTYIVKEWSECNMAGSGG